MTALRWYVNVIDATAGSRVWHLAYGSNHTLLVAIKHTNQTLVGATNLKLKLSRVAKHHFCMRIRQYIAFS